MKKPAQIHTLYLGSLALLLLAGQTGAFAQGSREHDRSSGQQRSSGDQRSSDARQATPQRSYGNQRSADVRNERPLNSFGNQHPADIRQASPQRSFGNQGSADAGNERPPNSFGNQHPAGVRRESPRRIAPNNPQRSPFGDRNGAQSSVRNQPNSPQRSYGNPGDNDLRRNTSYNRETVWPQRQNNDNRNSYGRNEDRYENRNGGSYGYRPVYGNSYRPRYTRPPMVWEGRRYYSMYNYTYHPYHPFYYGSYFHPIGFFTAALNFGTLSIFWNNLDYRYYDGAYYQPYNNGYRVVAPPYGAGIPYLPNGYSTIVLGSDTFYYFGGIFYYHDGNNYVITQAPPGAVVYDLPDGCTDVVVGNISYLQYNNTLFQPIVLNGRNAYEVVEFDEDNQ